MTQLICSWAALSLLCILLMTTLGTTVIIKASGTKSSKRQWNHFPQLNVSYQVFVLVSRGNGNADICSGAVVESRHVLTAASCVLKPESEWVPKTWVLLAPINNTDPFLKMYHVVRETLYEKNSKDNVEGDIVLLQVDKVMDFKEKVVEPLPLQAVENFRSKNCSLLSWSESKPLARGGIITTAPLRALTLMAVGRKRCVSRWSNHQPPVDLLCLGRRHSPRDTCQEDPGAPVVCDGHLAAVVLGARGCGTFSFALYADIAFYSEWLRRTVARADTREDLPRDAWERAHLREEPPRRRRRHVSASNTNN